MVELSSVSVKHFISYPRLATRYKNTENHSHARISTQTESDMHLQSFADTHTQTHTHYSEGIQKSRNASTTSCDSTKQAFLIKCSVGGGQALIKNQNKLHSYCTVWCPFQLLTSSVSSFFFFLNQKMSYLISCTLLFSYMSSMQ